MVTSYEGVIVRDNWRTVTDVPWWYAGSGVVDQEVAWSRDLLEKTGLDWLTVAPCPSRAERARYRYEQRPDGVWRVDGATGQALQLSPPKPSGPDSSCASDRHSNLDNLPATESAVDKLIPLEKPFVRETFLAEGRHDVAAAIRQAVDPFLYGQMPAPLWALYNLLGYEGLMVWLVQESDLAAYAGQRMLRNLAQQVQLYRALGADAIWIEECLTDQINPQLFRTLNVPLMRQCVAVVRAAGLKSIYYYCGNPNDRLDAILDIGADALHLEESKKGFTIDIAKVVETVDRRCLVFGNIDAIGLLPTASPDQLRSALRTQWAAARRNGNRFVMSTGSPVTPATPVERVRLYADLARELSQS